MATKVARPALVKSILGTPVEVYESASSEDRHRVDRMLRAILPVSRRVAGLLNEGEIAANLTRYPLETMRVPTLVISAADDLYDTYECGLHTAEHIRDARFTGFSTGGHLLLGHEAEVRSEITTFLQEHIGGRAAVAV
jgi:pimeloyl-ACP methyl ester carboxylesterase